MTSNISHVRFRSPISHTTSSAKVVSFKRLTRDKSDPLNIIRQASRTEIRRHFFSQRVVALWNKIPSEIKQLNSVAAFKNNIVKMLKLNML